MLPLVEKINLHANKETVNEKIMKDVIEKPLGLNKKILLVEDDEMSIELIKKFLTDRYKLDFCYDGEAAVLKAKENFYALILMDIKLGGKLNGIETAQKIREMANYKNTPIVAITALAMRGDEKKFFQVVVPTTYQNLTTSKL